MISNDNDSEPDAFEQLHDLFWRCNVRISEEWATKLGHNKLLAQAILDICDGQEIVGDERSLVIGDYQLLELIGVGGEAVVFKALYSGGEVRALKILLSPTERALRRFEQGYRTGIELSQASDEGSSEGRECIVLTLDFSAKHKYLAMEYVDGTSLDKLCGSLSAATALDYIRRASAGFQYAHERLSPIFHRDIKPSNLLVENEIVENKKIRIIDWGLGRVEEAMDASVSQIATRITQGEMLGTFHYMSPEQFVDCRDANSQSDIYSLGCTMFTLLTGQHVYEFPNKLFPSVTTPTSVEVGLSHNEAPIPSLPEALHENKIATDFRAKDLEDLDTLFQGMVAKESTDRISSMREIHLALSNLQ